MGGRRWSAYVAAFLTAHPVCHLCGKKIDLSLPRGHEMAGTVDHLVPVSRGGARWDPSNHRSAHRLCNMRRGVRAVEQVGETSRSW